MISLFGVTIQINFWTGAVLAIPILVWFALNLVEFMQKHTKYWKTEDKKNEEEAVKKLRAETSAIFQLVSTLHEGHGDLSTKVNGLERKVSTFYEENIRQQAIEARDISSLTEDLAEVQEFFQKLNTEMGHRFSIHDQEQKGIAQKVDAVHAQVISKSLAREQEKAFTAIERMSHKIETLVESHSGSTGIVKNWWCQCTLASQTPNWPVLEVLREKVSALHTETVAFGSKMGECSNKIVDVQQYTKRVVDPILVAVQQSVVLLTEVSKTVRELHIDVLRRPCMIPNATTKKERGDER